MARIYGITGKMKGKYGNAVFRVRRGTQVMAQYNPEVANPSTKSQVAARSRLKLMSQLSAIYASVIAIPQDGSKTPRNQFVQRNYPYSSNNGDNAQIDLPVVQLTKSAREMEQFVVVRDANNIEASLGTAAKHSRVVYVVVAKNSAGNLRVFGSQVVEADDPEVAYTFPMKMSPGTDEAIVVYAYAIDDLNNKATAAFGDINSPTAQDIAQLLASRQVSLSDVMMTATAGVYMEVGTAAGVSEESRDSSIVVAQPTIGGETPFVDNTQVTISGPAGATLYYTTDGSTPTESSTEYPSGSAAINITETTTFKAIAVVNGVRSAVTTKTFTKNTGGTIVVMAPTISGAVNFTDSAQVTMSAESGATIYYTIDGSTPTSNSREYTGAITITDTTTIKAVSILQGQSSAVTTKTFTKVQGGDGI